MTRRKINIHRPVETGAWVSGLDETGTIVSAFDKAVNIRVSDRRLVSIVRQATAMTPMGVHCPSLLDGKGFRLGIGMTVTFAKGIAAADGWRMDTRGTKRFEGYPAVEKPLGVDTHKLDRFEKILHFSGQKDGLLGITRNGEPRNRFIGKGRKIVDKIMSCDSAHIARHLAEFAGLGPGFTPAGDDLIGGFLMGESLVAREHRLFPDELPVTRRPTLYGDPKSVLLKAAEGTNDAGRTLIWMALMGRFPKFLCRAAVSLHRAETAKDMLAMVTRATRYGHTSGTDALTGLLLYLKTRHRHLKHSRPQIEASIDAHPEPGNSLFQDLRRTRRESYERDKNYTRCLL